MSGHPIGLEPLDHALLPIYQRWTNDFGVTRAMYLAAPVPATQLHVNDEAAIDDTHSVSFTIFDLAT